MTRSDSSKKTAPDFLLEKNLYAQGLLSVVGVDEAGRGPLAGPVVAAAVILDPHNIPDGLNDSKKLSSNRRSALFSQIVSSSIVSIASAPPHLIKSLNIRGATLWAMTQAVSGLAISAEHVLVDGRDIPPGLDCKAQAVIGGDGKSVSIAAASIVAKVTRDRMCATLDMDYPEFGFSRHKGYGTAAHMTALQNLGPTPHHREEFAPVAAALRMINRVD